MVYLLFGIRYLSQLKRTRPALVSRLQSSVGEAIRGAGGALSARPGVLSGGFDDGAIAFGLDLILALESIAASTAEAERELFGRACLVGERSLGEDEEAAAIRRFSADSGGTGIWCDGGVAGRLEPYAEFSAPAGEYRQLLRFDFRTERANRPDEESILAPAAATLIDALDRGKGGGPEGYAILGPARSGKRWIVERAVASRFGEGPLLRVRFSPCAGGLATLADMLASAENGLGLHGASGSAVGDPLGAASRQRLSGAKSSTLERRMEERLVASLSGYASSRDASSVPAFVLIEKLAAAPTWARELVAPRRSGGGLVDAEDREPSGGKALRDRVGRSGIGNICPVFLLDDDASELVPGVERLVCLSPDRPVPYLKRLETMGWRFSAEGRPLLAPPALSRDFLELAYAFSLIRGLFPASWHRDLLAQAGKVPELFDLVSDKLVSLGIIDYPDEPGDPFPAFEDYAARVLGDRGEAVRSLVRRRLIEQEADKRLVPSQEFLVLLESLGASCDADLCARSAFADALASGAEGRVAEAGSGAGAKPGRFASLRCCPRPEVLERLYQARSALVRGTAAVGEGPFLAPAPESSAGDRYRDLYLMELASLQAARGTLKEATASAKAAVINLQERGDGSDAARAYRILGETALASYEGDEGAEYLEFASEAASRIGDRYEMLLADAASAIAQFLRGNYSKAALRLDAAARIADDDYRDEWVAWLRFLGGRIAFEVGRYEIASERFLQASDLSEACSAPGARDLCRAWRGRAARYAGRVPEPDDFAAGESCPDAALFLAEALLLDGRADEAKRALSAFEAAIENAPPVRACGMDRIRWDSGFSMVEERLFGGAGPNAMYRRLILSLRGLASLRSGADEEAVAGLRALVKEDRAQAFDPHAPFYAFCLYRSIDASGASTIDRATVLSTAFKRLQGRATRIDDVELRRSYISASRWNSQLMEEARAHKLI